MAKKDKWMKQRKADILELRELHYIFSEGEKTEPYYFNGFKKYIDLNPIYQNSVEIHATGLGLNTTGVVKAASEYVKEHNIRDAYIWCVYDKDDFSSDDFNNAKYMTEQLSNNQNGVIYSAIWSNQCFELWFILHFANYQSNNDRKFYYKYLNVKFRELGLDGYEKNIRNIFDILLNNGDPKNAIKFAKKLTENKDCSVPSSVAPATMAYRLVEKLAEYLPEEIKNRFI